MLLPRGVFAAFLVLACACLFAACSQSSRLNMQCVAGDLQRCRQLGDMYAQGNGVPQDFARAASRYEPVCEAGVAEVCNTLGEIYERVAGFETEAKRVPALFERACNAGSANGCLNWGILASESEDYEKAAGLYERACVGGVGGGCHRLALAFENGEGVAQDVRRAVTLFEQACDVQHIESCQTLVRLFTEGSEVPADPARVARYNAQLLQIFSDGCDAAVTRDCNERDKVRARLTATAPGAATAAGGGVAPIPK
jgi:uncharacterized protein